MPPYDPDPMRLTPLASPVNIACTVCLTISARKKSLAFRTRAAECASGLTGACKTEGSLTSR
jgi:hypothetical protein